VAHGRVWRLARWPPPAACVRLAIERAKGIARDRPGSRGPRARQWPAPLTGHGRSAGAWDLCITRLLRLDPLRAAAQPPAGWPGRSGPIPGRPVRPRSGIEIQLELLENGEGSAYQGCVLIVTRAFVDGHLVSGDLVFRNWPARRPLPAQGTLSSEAIIKALIPSGQDSNIGSGTSGPCWSAAAPSCGRGGWACPGVAAGPGGHPDSEIREVGRNGERGIFRRTGRVY